MARRVGPIIGSVVFFALAPGIVAGWIPYTLSRWELRPPFFGLAVIRWAGVILLVGSVAVLVDSFARFALEGRGTPAPVAPTNSLVVSGLYRYVRNPMYVAVVGAILGQALLAGQPRPAGLRGRDLDAVPPVRPRLRGAHAPPAVRHVVRGLSAGRPALVAAPAALERRAVTFPKMARWGVAAVALHNVEEALTIPVWLPPRLAQLEAEFGIRPLAADTGRLYVGLVLATVIPAIWVAAAYRSPPRTFGAYSIVVLYGVFLANALVPHLAGAVLLGGLCARRDHGGPAGRAFRRLAGPPCRRRRVCFRARRHRGLAGRDRALRPRRVRAAGPMTEGEVR